MTNALPHTMKSHPGPWPGVSGLSCPQGAGAQGVHPGAAGWCRPQTAACRPGTAGARSGSLPGSPAGRLHRGGGQPEPVTNHEVRLRLARLQRQVASQGGRNPTRAAGAGSAGATHSGRAQIQLAREAGITVDDLAVEQAEQSVARQNEVTVPRCTGAWPPMALAEQFRQELRRQLTQQRLREREVDARVRVSDHEIDQYLREQARGRRPGPGRSESGPYPVAVP